MVVRNVWLVSYDISEPSRQRAVRKLLLGYGDPLHYSVFLVTANKTEFKKLTDEINAAIEESEDRILFFNCGKNHDTVLSKLTHLGRPPEKDILGEMIWIF